MLMYISGSFYRVSFPDTMWDMHRVGAQQLKVNMGVRGLLTPNRTREGSSEPHPGLLLPKHDIIEGLWRWQLQEANTSSLI